MPRTILPTSWDRPVPRRAASTVLGAVALSAALPGCAGQPLPRFDGRQMEAAGDARFTPPEEGRAVGPFPTLTDHHGRPFGEAALAGRWRLVGFGYASCVDQCPNLLATMGDALDLLGQTPGTGMTAIFVSIDPERDVPARLRALQAAFHPDLVAVTGEEADLAGFARRFGVRFWRVPPADPVLYRMDHTSLLYLVDPDGRVRRSFWPQEGPERVAEALGTMRGRA